VQSIGGVELGTDFRSPAVKHHDCHKTCTKTFTPSITMTRTIEEPSTENAVQSVTIVEHVKAATAAPVHQYVDGSGGDAPVAGAATTALISGSTDTAVSSSVPFPVVIGEVAPTGDFDSSYVHGVADNGGDSTNVVYADGDRVYSDGHHFFVAHFAHANQAATQPIAAPPTAAGLRKGNPMTYVTEEDIHHPQSTILESTVQHIAQQSTVQQSTVQYTTIYSSTVQQSNVQQNGVQSSSSRLAPVESSMTTQELSTEVTAVVATKPAPRPFRLGHFADFNHAIATQSSASAIPSSSTKPSSLAKAKSVPRSRPSSSVRASAYVKPSSHARASAYVKPSSPTRASAYIKPSSNVRASSSASVPRPASYVSRSTPIRSSVLGSSNVTPSQPSVMHSIAPHSGILYLSVASPTTVYSDYTTTTTTTSATRYVTQTFYDTVTHTITDCHGCQDQPSILLITKTRCRTFTHAPAVHGARKH
jgi:hypothetical protein